MAARSSGKWQQKLREHCAASGMEPPNFQDVSDRRGGRTAWSCIAVVHGVPYSARFWYDGTYVEQAREDAAEIAYNAVTGTSTSAAQNTAYYSRGYGT